MDFDRILSVMITVVIIEPDFDHRQLSHLSLSMHGICKNSAETPSVFVACRLSTVATTDVWLYGEDSLSFAVCVSVRRSNRNDSRLLD